jgi:benzoylformate decarboxylase
MEDWAAPAADPEEQVPAAARVLHAAAVDEAALDELVALLETARSPAIVVGAGADDPGAWTALVMLARNLGAPVWQESFGARAGFPQDDPRFAGHLPADRTRLRAVLDPYDVVLVVGAPAFRQYPYAPGPLHRPGLRVAVVTDDASEASRSAAELALVAPVAATCAELARRVPAREAGADLPVPEPLAAPAPHNPLMAGHVFASLAERLPSDAVLVEETPSSRPELHVRVPARSPLGFVSAAMGGLGFAIPAAIGLRMAVPDRPVLAVVGDGSSLYSVQALWTAAHYRVGALFLVLANGGYAVMDRLAERQGGASPWPRFDVDVAGIARALGCPARSVADAEGLGDALDEALPGLASRAEPFLLEVAVAPDEVFEP